ncbi:hypothetical protein SAMN02745673_03199 [Marinactinospora thermotolerans DSM 45154]|uniref:Integral membrane protein n=1 Tax=Marinactinospora thermotolerans DSM 45154 TaxID=1122192 RepID=A0A1T4S5A2_9ACTN|nr:hypothetical protein [Marinactinospora thermotolerans]SKA23296.1 hypothetical protein SAMN02745673_03199 [Marinactinospora thermotolerans DSM 45154]
MTMTRRSTPGPRTTTLAAAAGGGAGVLAGLLAYGVVLAVSALFPTPDANIGLGMAALLIQIVGTAVATWGALRLLGVPGAGVAAGTVALAGVVAPFTSLYDPAPPMGMVVWALGAALFAAVGVQLAAFLRRGRG